MRDELIETAASLPNRPTLKEIGSPTVIMCTTNAEKQVVKLRATRLQSRERQND